MKINFSPRFEPYGTQLEEALSIARQGNSLIINGVHFDFSAVPPGATLPDGYAATGCHYMTGQIERDETGTLHVHLVLPYAAGAPESARFPAPIIDPPDGLVTLPETNWPPAPVQTEQGGDDASN